MSVPLTQPLYCTFLATSRVTVVSYKAKEEEAFYYSR